ncbi:NB-ARC domain-containing protein [Paludisphaera rhizosphaerae]|uniref:NB-ARC domain-containing protein n=1 Tax=Paludisphaera rhizosphaerae TaxID=2711216 RepID=UPI001980656B|nr:NB-ARC domain-containing protein [Paludisphaera rhizosphaerae]
MTPPRQSRVEGLPAVSPEFVERSNAADAIRKALEGETPASSTAVISALHGLGGVGKTALAASVVTGLADSGAFPDGIFWLTLGEESTEPQRLAWLGDLVHFFGDSAYQARETAPTSARLRSLLRGKRALIVVDDAWAAEHLEPFRVVDKTSRLLVTTRDASAVPGVAPIKLGAMSPAEARELIDKRLTHPLRANEEALAAELAEELGNLPLALALAASEVNGGVPWGELLKEFRKEVADLRILEPPGTEEKNESDQRRLNLSVRASFRVGLRRMSSEERERFAWLGVFQEDASVIPEHLTRLWTCDLPKARKSFRYLHDKSLLAPGVPLPDGTPTYRLHDLLRHEAIHLLTSPTGPKEAFELPGLGLDLADAHGRYLDLSRGRADVPWHAVAEDGYLYDHLIWHLEQAGRFDEIHVLLWTEDEAGKNGWHRARLRLGQLSGYFADVERAWQLADDEFASDPSPAAMIRQVRCSLIRASTLGSVIPFELLKAAVDSGTLTAEAALTYARCCPDLAEGVRSRIALISHFGPAVKRSLIAEALENLLPIIGGHRGIEALASLAPLLNSAQLSGALESVLTIRTEERRVQALAILAPALNHQQRPYALNAALAAALTITDASTRASELIRLAPLLDGQDRGRAIDAALESTRTVTPGISCVKVVVELTPFLDDPQRTRVLDAVLGHALSIPQATTRAHVLTLLAPILNGQQRTRALDAALPSALAIPKEEARVHILAKLIPTLDNLHRATALESALGSALAIARVDGRIEALMNLIPLLDNSQRAHILGLALESALAITHATSRVGSLLRLIPLLDDSQKFMAVDATLASLTGMRSNGSHTGVLRTLAPMLDTSRVECALKAASAISDEQTRARALIALARRLEGEARAYALENALAIALAAREESGCAQLLATMAPLLDEQQRGHALNIVLTMHDEQQLADAVIALIPLLNADQRACKLDEILLAASTIANPHHRAKLLTTLAPSLNERQRDLALDAAFDIENECRRAQALSGLAPFLNEHQRRLAVDSALSISDAPPRASALTALAEGLSEPNRACILNDALLTASTIGNEHTRVEILAALIPDLSEPQRTSAIADASEAASAIPGPYNRFRAFKALAATLDGTMRGRALDAALVAASSMPRGEHRVTTLATLAHELGDQRRVHVFDESIDDALSIPEKPQRARTLVKLANCLCGPWQVRAIDEALMTASEVRGGYFRGSILQELARFPEPSIQARIADLTCSLEDSGSSIEESAAVLPLLTGMNRESVSKQYRHHWPSYLHEQTRSCSPPLLRSDLISRVFMQYLASPEAIDGPPLMKGLAETIVAVGRWWP